MRASGRPGGMECRTLYTEIKLRGYTGFETQVRAWVHPLREARLPQATVRFETEPRQTSPGRLGQLWLHRASRSTAQVVCFRHDPGLVENHVCRFHQFDGHGYVATLSRACLALLWRRTARGAARQSQDRRTGARRRREHTLEPALSGSGRLLWLFVASLPALPGTDHGQSGVRHPLSAWQLLAGLALGRLARPEPTVSGLARSDGQSAGTWHDRRSALRPAGW